MAATETRTCGNCGNRFTIEPDDFAFYEKIQVPPPTFCPECRLVRRLLFRNERDYYKRSCDLCGRSTISVYPADFPTPVYCVKCWWSDRWDPTSYGRDYDPSRPFREQVRELFVAVPVIAMQNDDGIGSVNCPYTYDFAFGKNCYMTQVSWEIENVMYSWGEGQAKDLSDCYFATSCNLCYEVMNSRDCYGCAFCDFCFSCQGCFFGYDLRGCSDCILSVGLRNKRYCIWNVQYSKEEYEKKKAELHLERRENLVRLAREFREFTLRCPRRYAQLFKSTASTGEALYNCKAARDCFYFKELEDSRYMMMGDGGKGNYDCNNTGRPTMCYECVTPDNSYGNLGAVFCWKCTQAEYSNNCHSCQYVLGSSALRQTQYAILNKRYDKETFGKVRDEIRQEMLAAGHWGEFFPASMSPHAYNETPAQDWVPLTREEAIARGFRWKEKQAREYAITISPEQIPQTIGEVSDAILEEALGCRNRGDAARRCTTAFKIVLPELQFYRAMHLPLPDACHNCRYHERLSRRNLAKLYHRECTCAGAQSSNGAYANTVSHFHGSTQCPNEFETSYAPDRPEIVYCEACYNAEVA